MVFYFGFPIYFGNTLKLGLRFEVNVFHKGADSKYLRLSRLNTLCHSHVCIFIVFKNVENILGSFPIKTGQSQICSRPVSLPQLYSTHIIFLLPCKFHWYFSSSICSNVTLSGSPLRTFLPAALYTEHTIWYIVHHLTYLYSLFGLCHSPHPHPHQDKPWKQTFFFFFFHLWMVST